MARVQTRELRKGDHVVVDKQTFRVTNIKVSYTEKSSKTYYVEVDDVILMGPYGGHRMWTLADVPLSSRASGPPKMTAADWEAVYNSPLGPVGGRGSEMSGSG